MPTALPEMESRTVNSITLKTIDGGTTPQGDAYSVQYGRLLDETTGEISWQDTTTFTGLTPGVEYTFYTRNQVTDQAKVANYTHNGCSDNSQGVKLSIERVTPPQANEGFTIDYVNEIITIGNGYEAAKDASFDDNVKINSGDKITPGSTVYVRYAATDDKPASVGTENAIAARPETPKKPEITQTAKMVQVTNGAAGQEYMFKKPTDTNHTATFDVWQDSPVLIDDDMTDGATYTVTTRVKATDTTFASEEINSTYQPQNIPENGVRLDGGSTGINWKDMEDSSNNI